MSEMQRAIQQAVALTLAAGIAVIWLKIFEVLT